MRTKISMILLSAALVCPVIVGAQSEDLFTLPKVKELVIIGKTIQGDILQKYGSPNVTAQQNHCMPKVEGVQEMSCERMDVWGYTRVSRESTSDQGSGSVAGRIPGIPAWARLGRSSTESKTATQSTSLTIYFDDKGVVRDYNFSDRKQ